MKPAIWRFAPLSSSSHAACVLTPEQKAQVDALLDRLLDVPDEQRLSHFARDTTVDSTVRAEVESVLRAAQSAGDFLIRKPREAEEERSEEIAVGTQLGVWRITARIGRGGMGEVFEARR